MQTDELVAQSMESSSSAPSRGEFEVVPREGRRIEIEGRPIHYVDEGEGRRSCSSMRERGRSCGAT
jgi:hypothetical protein